MGTHTVIYKHGCLFYTLKRKDANVSSKWHSIFDFLIYSEQYYIHNKIR